MTMEDITMKLNCVWSAIFADTVTINRFPTPFKRSMFRAFPFLIFAILMNMLDSYPELFRQGIYVIASRP